MMTIGTPGAFAFERLDVGAHLLFVRVADSEAGLYTTESHKDRSKGFQ